ncbi:MotE family protein [Zhengella sp. ZM62]|uniref:MotE family protein n=1 Tax=Zhengella sedimenti TaxID=3390035 RepID=UPI0039749542
MTAGLRPSIGLAALLAAGLAGFPGAARAQEIRDVSVDGSQAAGDAARYCTNITQEMQELRYRIKEEKLRQLQSEVEAKLAELDSKRRELEEWVGLRDGFANRATEALVEIYQKMRPDAAAARLEEISPQLASSILLALPAAKAGVILNEMEPKRAAAVTMILAAAARKDDGT